jgi:hypothetical protein
MKLYQIYSIICQEQSFIRFLKIKDYNKFTEG